MADQHHTLPPQETLAVMNSHLGRFLIHADELIQECRSFGDSVQRSVEGQLDKMNGTVARALDDAAARAATTLDGKLEQALGERLHALRDDIDEIVRLSGSAAAVMRSRAGDDDGSVATAVPLPAALGKPARGVLVPALLTLANLMLAAILVLLVRGPDGAGAGDQPVAAVPHDAGVSASAASGDAGTGAPQVAGGAPLSALEALCESLADGGEAGQAHAFVAASAAAACTSTAGAVTANVILGLTGSDAEQVIPQGRGGDGKRSSADKPKRPKQRQAAPKAK
ncbi:MAG: hypothetical protein Tsb0020_51790 [Haliangiales bacterium]